MDADSYVRGHWDGLHCEANGGAFGMLNECEHVGRIAAPAVTETTGLDVERLARALLKLPPLVVDITGDRGEVTVRCWGKGFRIKATSYDGDAAVEALLAAHTVGLLQEVMRSVAGDPEMQMRLVSLRHIDDHEAP